jgi:nucleotide-binding universal stress UspA family protein
MSVVVAYTQSPEGVHALEAGAAEARLRGTGLHVVTVQPHEAGDSPTQARRDLTTSGALEQHLTKVRAQLEAADLEVTTELLHTLTGEETEHILELLPRVGAELLVVGVRRRSAVGKLVLGSVSRDLLLASPVPVLAVKAPRPEG